MKTRQMDKVTVTENYAAIAAATYSVFAMINFLKNNPQVTRSEFHEKFRQGEIQNRLHAWEITH